MAKIITIEDFAKRLKLTKCVAKTILSNYRFTKFYKRIKPTPLATRSKKCVIISEEFIDEFHFFIERFRPKINHEIIKRELEELLVESI